MSGYTIYPVKTSTGERWTFEIEIRGRKVADGMLFDSKEELIQYITEIQELSGWNDED
jgi:hypothetical protein